MVGYDFNAKVGKYKGPWLLETQSVTTDQSEQINKRLY